MSETARPSPNRHIVYAVAEYLASIHPFDQENERHIDNWSKSSINHINANDEIDLKAEGRKDSHSLKRSPRIWNGLHKL